MAFLSQPPVFLTILGLALLILEFAVLGFSTLFLVFVSLACFGTALLQQFNLLPQDALWSTGSVAVQTAIFALLLWKPLRRLQNRQQAAEDQPSSFNGLQFRLNSELSPTLTSSHQYSGVNWIVELDASCNKTLAAGTTVVVTRTSVGKMQVTPIE